LLTRGDYADCGGKHEFSRGRRHVIEGAPPLEKSAGTKLAKPAFKGLNPPQNTSMNHQASSQVSQCHHTPPVIFVVDDDPALLELTELLLRSKGYDLRAFCSPYSALEALKQCSTPPDLLLTDYDMGTMNGIELIERFRALFPQLRSVVISGTIEPEVILYHPTKVSGFISKPFKPDDLLARVEAILTRG
jgi:CheY-like chemotaxis protein